MKGYRKFSLALIFVAIGLATSAVAHHGEAIPQGLVELLLGLYGAFVGGNIGEHWVDGKPVVGPTVAQATTKDETLHAKADQVLAATHVSQQALEFLVTYIKNFEAQKAALQAQHQAV